MRDILLAGNAGFIFSCVGGFLVHRALWKSADEHAQQLDAMVGNETNQASTSAARRQTESFEGFIGRRVAQIWNAGVDNVHSRLVGLPNTLNRLVDDVKGGGRHDESNKQVE